MPCSADGPRLTGLTSGNACFPGGRAERAQPDPRAAWLAVMGRGAGVGRPAAAGEDTALRPDDALGRRLPFDGQTGGCVADKSRKQKDRRAGGEPGKARSNPGAAYGQTRSAPGARITLDQSDVAGVG